MNVGTPSISVVIPAFNEEYYLPDTLQAVENSAALLRSRHHLKTEVIVVDNGSADDTAKVAGSFRRPCDYGTGTQHCACAEPRGGGGAGRSAGFP